MPIPKMDRQTQKEGAVALFRSFGIRSFRWQVDCAGSKKATVLWTESAFASEASQGAVREI